MKLGNLQENEHVISVQTSPRKSYNPFESDDEDTDAYTKSSINGFDIKSFETADDSLTFHLDSSDLSWEEAVIGHSRMISNSITADASNDEVLYRKDTELFTDKTVTECGLPELVFSYKDNGFHAVKDIGIDEGVPTQDKLWIKTQANHDSNTLSDVLGLTEDATGDVPFKEGLKSRSHNDVEKDPSVQNQIEDSVKESGLIHEALGRPYSSDECTTDECQNADETKQDSIKKEEESISSWQRTDSVENDFMANGKNDPCVYDKEEVNCHKVEKTGNEITKEYCKDSLPLKQAEISSLKPSMVHEVKAAMDFNENQSEEVATDQCAELADAVQEPASNGVSNALSYNSKVESGSIILDFNADAAAATATATVPEKEKEEIPRMKEAVEKPPEAQNMSRDDVGAPGFNILDCGTDKRVHGETSFSAASITYMGPHAHIGSISLRSESSTGSTRSFAFPVLQAEWNSSPVRMAKADQRHFRKARGWVHSLVCCKF